MKLNLINVIASVLMVSTATSVSALSLDALKKMKWKPAYEPYLVKKELPNGLLDIEKDHLLPSVKDFKTKEEIVAFRKKLAVAIRKEAIFDLQKIPRELVAGFKCEGCEIGVLSKAEIKQLSSIAFAHSDYIAKLSSSNSSAPVAKADISAHKLDINGDGLKDYIIVNDYQTTALINEKVDVTYLGEPTKTYIIASPLLEETYTCRHIKGKIDAETARDAMESLGDVIAKAVPELKEVVKEKSEQAAALIKEKAPELKAAAEKVTKNGLSEIEFLIQRAGRSKELMKIELSKYLNAQKFSSLEIKKRTENMQNTLTAFITAEADAMKAKVSAEELEEIKKKSLLFVEKAQEKSKEYVVQTQDIAASTADYIKQQLSEYGEPIEEEVVEEVEAQIDQNEEAFHASCDLAIETWAQSGLKDWEKVVEENPEELEDLPIGLSRKKKIKRLEFGFASLGSEAFLLKQVHGGKKGYTLVFTNDVRNNSNGIYWTNAIPLKNLVSGGE